MRAALRRDARRRGVGRDVGVLERSNLLLVALDRRAEWYRYHHLLRDLLGAELRRREPEIVPRLHLGRPRGTRPTAFPSWRSTTRGRPVTPTRWRGWSWT